MLFLLPPIESLAVAFVPWALGGLFVAPMVLNPFAASFRSGREREVGSAAHLPGRVDAANDLPVFTPERGAGLVRRPRTGDCPGSWSPFWTITLTAGKRIRASGRAATRAPSWCSRPTRPIRTRHFRSRGRSRAGRRDLRDWRTPRSTSTWRRTDAARRLPVADQDCLTRRKSRTCSSGRSTITTRGGFTPIFFDPNAPGRALSRRARQTDARNGRGRSNEDRGRHLQPAEGRGRPHGDRARADARACAKRGTRPTSSSRPITASAVRPPPTWPRGAPMSRRLAADLSTR